MVQDFETTNGHHSIEIWPTKFLEKSSKGGDSHSAALIVLNSPIPQFEYFYLLYKNASFRVWADGAANRVHDLLISQFPEHKWSDALRTATPDMIHGDLDSLHDSVRSRYEQVDVHVSEDPDQYSTDFGKAIKKVLEKMPNVQDVLVLGSIGGRVDQGIGLLGEFYREQKIHHPDLRFWLFSESSVSTILRPGTTQIHTPLSTGLIKRNIGILPLYGPASISTEGFEWDVQDWPTEMGGQMSTSNHIVADLVSVTTDKEVLFTVQRATDGGS